MSDLKRLKSMAIKVSLIKVLPLNGNDMLFELDNLANPLLLDKIIFLVKILLNFILAINFIKIFSWK